MENRAHALAAGLFTLLLGLGVIAAGLWFGGEVEAHERYLLESRLPVSGLNLQAPVKFRGLEVGKVTSIEFAPDDPRTILIGVAVKSDTPVTRGTFARLGAQGITGLSYVMLDDDGSRPGRIAGDAAARIPVRASFFEQIAGSGQEVMAQFGQAASRVSAFLDEQNQVQFRRTLANFEAASGRVAALAESLQPAAKALGSEAGVVLKRADTLLANLDALSRKAHERVEAFDRVAGGAERFAASGAALADSMLNDSLPRVYLLMDDLARASRSLDRMMRDLDEQPASLVFGWPPPPPGPGESGFVAPAGGRP